MQSIGFTDPYASSSSTGSPNSSGSSFGSLGGNISGAGGVISGLASGTPTGYASAGLSAGGLASRNGVFGSNAGNVNTGLAEAGSALGIYSGLKQGGVAGDMTAAVSAGKLATEAGYLGGTSGALGSALPFAGLALGAYDFATQDTKSGATGADALGGAETGAEAGMAFGPIGGLIGGVVGGVAGAISSAFGGGERDPETTSFNSMVAANAKTGSNAVVQSLNPTQAYQSLAGMMDAKNNTAGHSTPLEMVFGREGEGNMMSQMSTTINSAISSGKISKSATPTQLYNQVVVPWLQSKGAYTPSSAIISANGTKNNGTIDTLITQLIGQWQSGQLNGSSKVGVSGQTIQGLQAYGA